MTIKNQARAVVIGGGVVGASILYHLTKYKGFEDSVLLERTELTAGSTWHAAGLLPLFNMSYTVGKIHKNTIDLYNSLEKETVINLLNSRKHVLVLYLLDLKITLLF